MMPDRYAAQLDGALRRARGECPPASGTDAPLTSGEARELLALGRELLRVLRHIRRPTIAASVAAAARAVAQRPRTIIGEMLREARAVAARHDAVTHDDVERVDAQDGV